VKNEKSYVHNLWKTEKNICITCGKKKCYTQLMQKEKLYAQLMKKEKMHNLSTKEKIISITCEK
jgi:hypothetical protein